jgi:hypothetical protein
MIGVISNAADEPAAREFFELFKTPWEPYRAGRRYPVVLSASDDALAQVEDVDADLVIRYGPSVTGADGGRPGETRRGGSNLRFRGARLRVYGETAAFGEGTPGLLAEESDGRPVTSIRKVGGRVHARVGYDLFGEVEYLLRQGQPAESAPIPALDLHIALLRTLITESGVGLIEIPPVPRGYPFIACLTHDLDHASMRSHGLDRTTFGFLYRATLGSALGRVRGRLTSRRMLTNWLAAAKLPLVHLGVARDFWHDFDAYLDIEQDRPSTFFVVPYAGRSGRTRVGEAPGARKVAYDLSEVSGKLKGVLARNSEVGLHGIDAWLSGPMGKDEAARVSEATGSGCEGVRMHWLYMDSGSAAALDQAGFAYDSTVGYNETVGYRAGTSQAFKPFDASSMLELPMHVMDTALFFPSHMGLSERAAMDRVVPMIDHAVLHGGVLTVNWHDRSIAPERLWGDFYASLLRELTGRSAWFATASQAASWFRMRREAVFEHGDLSSGLVRIRKVPGDPPGLPGLTLRVHAPGSPPTDHDVGPVRASASETI